MQIDVDLDTSVDLIINRQQRDIYSDEICVAITDAVQIVFHTDPKSSVLTFDRCRHFHGALVHCLMGLGFRLGLNLDIEVDLSVRSNSANIRLLSYAMRLRDHQELFPTIH